MIDANEELTRVQKFLYLLTTLSDRASAIISLLPLLEANYPVAITVLKQRYDNPRRLVAHHCAVLSEFPTIRGHSLKDIRSFIDTFNVHFQALSNITGIKVMSPYLWHRCCQGWTSPYGPSSRSPMEVVPFLHPRNYN